MLKTGMTRIHAAALSMLLVACKTASQSETPPSKPAPPATVGPAQPAIADAALPHVAAPVTLTAVPPAIAATAKLQVLLKGLSRPVLITAAPGETSKRLYIVEQTGTVRVLEGGKLRAAPLLDVSNEISDGNEQGLLGLAFHPQFAQNHKLYVYLTDREGTSRVFEFAVAADRVVAASRRELLMVKQPYSNHNGGNLLFGPDGKLYLGLGDGGSGGDPKGNGQNPTALLGKLLRLDVDAAKPRAEIVHLGLRNPWRFAFDAANGNLFIGDVGQNLWEQVYAVAGTDTRKHNFGWNVVEGNHCFDAATCDRKGFTPPIADYSHDAGCSITGGVVYRGKALPALAGHYFYADFCTSLLRSVTWQPATPTPALGAATGSVTAHWDWKAALDPQGTLSQISSFGTDADGELYIVSLTGTIWQVVAASR